MAKLNWRNEIPHAFAGGITGLVIVCTYITARAYSEGAEAGDWLAFAGALIGVTGAIAVVTVIPLYKTYRSDNHAKTLMRDAAKDILNGLDLDGEDDSEGAMRKWAAVPIARDSLNDGSYRVSRLDSHQQRLLGTIRNSIAELEIWLRSGPDRFDPLQFGFEKSDEKNLLKTNINDFIDSLAE